MRARKQKSAAVPCESPRPDLVPLIEDDFARALVQLHFGKWERLKELAIQIAAERAIKENQARQDELIKRADELTGIENLKAHLRNSDELTRAFAEHTELLDIAYPRSKP